MLPILERLLFRPSHTRVSRVLILTPTRELAMQIHSVGKALSKHMNVDFCLVSGELVYVSLRHFLDLSTENINLQIS